MTYFFSHISLIKNQPTKTNPTNQRKNTHHEKKKKKSIMIRDAVLRS